MFWWRCLSLAVLFKALKMAPNWIVCDSFCVSFVHLLLLLSFVFSILPYSLLIYFTVRSLLSLSIHRPITNRMRNFLIHSHCNLSLTLRFVFWRCRVSFVLVGVQLQFEFFSCVLDASRLLSKFPLASILPVSRETCSWTTKEG